MFSIFFPKFYVPDFPKFYVPDLDAPDLKCIFSSKARSPKSPKIVSKFSYSVWFRTFRSEQNLFEKIFKTN